MRENIPTTERSTGNNMRHVSMAARMGCALLCVAGASACADTVQTLRPFVGIGYSSGGDTILPVTVTVKNASSTQYHEDISAGAGAEARAGLAFRPQGSAFSVRGSVGVHNDQSNGIDNDQAFFRRYPIEVQAVWHPGERWSMGLGARKATRAVFGLNNATIVSGSTTYTNVTVREQFSSSVGLVMEGEWAATPSWGLSLRYVRERFKTQDANPQTVNGDHLGLATQFYFN
jgi:hypothetical protein